MLFWNELEGHKGVDEVISSIWKSLTQSLEPLREGQQRTLVIWSDRCVGQTNNWPMVCFLLLLLKKNYFTTVEQKFVVSGHSFLECDKCFGSIEIRKRKCMVYIPDQWQDVITSSQPEKPFTVIRLTQDDIFNYKETLAIVRKPPTLRITETASLHINVEAPHRVTTRPDHVNGEATVHIIHANQPHVRFIHRRHFTLDELAEEFEKKHDRSLQLPDEKKLDLLSLMDYLSPEHRVFYLPHLDFD